MLLALGGLAVAYVVAYAVTPLTSKVARRFDILDHPDTDAGGRKQHEQATPYLGGVAIFAGLVCGAAVLLIGDHQSVLIRRFLIGISIALALGFIGLIDDITPLPRSVRLGGEVAAAIGAWSIGYRVQAAPWEWANILITVVWIVGIANAFNLLDNMDGLTSGLAGMSALSFAVMGVTESVSVVAVTAAALCGAAFGFLAHNRHPAKVFMGDAGALFLGFLLALIGIETKFDNLQQVTFLVPVVVLGLTIFDTSLVMLSRLRARRPVFLGGRDHVSHRLVRAGLPVRAAVGLLYWAAACLGWLGLVISRANVEVGWMLLGFVMALAVFFGVLLWRIPVYPRQDQKFIEAATAEESQLESPGPVNEAPLATASRSARQ